MKDFLGLPAWAWVAAALAALAGVAWLVRGRYRQLRARRAIDNVISAVAYDELRDVLLPTGAGDEIHLHYLLLTERGLLVIDLFDVAGLIFAGEKMQQWSVFGAKRHFTFANPLPMLYDRVAAVRQLAGELPVEGRVVFSMQGEFPKGHPEAVMRLDALHEQYPAVERSSGGAAAAFAPVWERIKAAAKPNPLAR